MKDSASMASQICNLFHLWVLPDAQLVVYETMWRQDLSIIRIPLKSTNLWFSLNWLNHIASLGVPKLYSLISWPSARSQKMSLPGAPSQRFYSCLMLSKAEPWLRYNLRLMRRSEHTTTHPGVNVPDAKNVIVTATSELLPIRTPFQTTDLLPVTRKGTH